MTQAVELDKHFAEGFVLQCAQQAELPLASIAPYYGRQAKPNQLIISFACLESAKTEAVVSNFARLLLKKP